MKTRDRFWGVVRRTPIDRLPLVEWATWWKDATIKRWYGEGLPAEVQGNGVIAAHFGQDDWRQGWFGPRAATAPKAASHGAPLVRDRREYEAFQQHLWPEPAANLDQLRSWAAAHARGDCVIWITLEGFFWFPRTLLGIENHLYAFYDQPDLMKDINARLTEYNLKCLKLIAEIVRPDFMTFAEDMSYNHGPMLSKALFGEFIAPYYRELLPHVKKMGTLAIIDSDGQVEPMASWLAGCGLDGVLPLERQAGVDVRKLQQVWPGVTLIGGYDKMVMPHGRAAMRAEFERLLPAMRAGRFFPSVDHQTPPGVSLENYYIYMELFKEYAARAVEGW